MTDSHTTEPEPGATDESAPRSPLPHGTPYPEHASPFPAEAETPSSKAVWILVFAALLAWAGLAGGWWLAATIVAVAVMITIHELGHYLTAKWAGMKVTEFFLGFGPRLWSFRRGETDYGVKPIMAGAYVRIVGMNNLEEVPPEDEARTYRQGSFPKRLIVVLAGPATHFLQVGLLVFLLLAVVGVPAGSLGTEPEWQVDAVTEESAAAAAGVEVGDRIVAFDGHEVESFEDLTEFIQDSRVGQEVALTVERDGSTFETTTEIGARPESAGGEEGTPFLGVGPIQPEVTMGVGEAILQTPEQSLAVTGTVLSGIGDLVSFSGIRGFADEVSEGGADDPEPAVGSGSSDSEANGRPVSIIGAVRIGGLLGERGLSEWLGFLITINIFLGLINLLPLLPFDGGHAVIAVYERIRSRNGTRYYADAAKMLPVAYAVIMGLIVLGVTTMYLDIVDPVG